MSKKVRSFKLSGDLLEKALKPKATVDVRGLHFIINYFDIIITKMIEDLEQKFSKKELFKLRNLGTFETYFDKADPKLSAKKFLKFEIARTIFLQDSSPNIIIKDLKNNDYTYEKLIDSLNEEESLALLVLLVNPENKELENKKN